MANTIKHKQSSVAAKVPLTTDLSLGEVAINTTDGILYFKKNVSSVESIVALSASANYLPLTGGSLSGGLVVEQASATADGLRVTLSNASATGKAFVVEDSTNPDTSPFAITADGTVLAGHTSTLAVEQPFSGVAGSDTGRIQVAGTSLPLSSIYSSAWSVTNGAAPAYVLAKSRGTTVGTHTAVADTDVLGFVSWQGSDGTKFVRAGDIRVVTDGTVASNIVPGRFLIRLANSSGALTDRLQILADGTATITGTLNATGGLRENGTALSALYAPIGGGGSASFVSMAKWGTD